MDLHLEDHGLAGQIRMIVLGEGDVQILLVAGLGAHQLLFEAGDEAVGTQLQAVVLTLAAVEGLAVQETLEVDDHGVAFLGLALHAHETGVAVGELLEALVHVSGGDLHLVLGSREALVLAQRDLGIHGSSGLEGEAVLRALAHHLHGGIAHDLELLLLHSGLIGIGERNIDGFLEKHLCAVHALDHLAGGLAGTEARDIDLLAHLLICLFDGSLKLRRTHLNGQRDLTFFQFFTAFDTHFVYSSVHHQSNAGAN